MKCHTNSLLLLNYISQRYSPEIDVSDPIKKERQKLYIQID